MAEKCVDALQGACPHLPPFAHHCFDLSTLALSGGTSPIHPSVWKASLPRRLAHCIYLPFCSIKQKAWASVGEG